LILSLFVVRQNTIAKYYIEYRGKRYPIKQVVSAITGLQRVAFTSRHAYSILTALGFEVKELKPGESE
jgi:5-methylcytosine-specific restriction protein B